MKTARQTAFDILQKIYKDDSYSNIALDTALEKSGLTGQDRAFTTAVVYGVIERRITLDYQLSLYLSQPIKKLNPNVLILLRMGAYQILFMDKVPSSAAVNETVKLSKTNRVAFASGLINAVLHKIDKSGLKLPAINDENYYEVKYSCPDWLCKMWIDAYGKDNAEKLLETSLGGSITVIRVNTTKTSTDELVGIFKNEGIHSEINNDVENSLIVKNSGAIYKTKAYVDGLFHVQDTASQLCCKALNVRQDSTLLDICSAPGGKAFTLSEMMNNSGKIYAFDIYQSRLKLISNGAERLGLSNIKTMENDGTKYNDDVPKVDFVLCDVPCSGLGVIRKKPEIRYKSRLEVDKLPDLQYSILCISVKYLKVGSIIIYSTCSLNPDENENVVKRFLNEHDDFESVRVLPELKRYGKDTDYISLMPHIHNCDGFFISAFKKVK